MGCLPVLLVVPWSQRSSRFVDSLFFVSVNLVWVCQRPNVFTSETSSWPCASCLPTRVRSNCVFGVGSARWPDGPRQCGVAHGLSLIPVTGVVDEDKTGGKTEKLRNTRVTWWADGMILVRHAESPKHLEPMRVLWMKCDTQREKCAHACVR